jgi:hypothetical protein
MSAYHHVNGLFVYDGRPASPIPDNIPIGILIEPRAFEVVPMNVDYLPSDKEDEDHECG